MRRRRPRVQLTRQLGGAQEHLLRLHPIPRFAVCLPQRQQQFTGLPLVQGGMERERPQGRSY